MKKIEFGIQPTMNAQELLKELHGRVSGETQDQVAVLERELKTNGAEIETLLDPVREYAVTRITVKGTDEFGWIRERYLYYLMGLNDEGLYFVHEIEKPRGVPVDD